MMGPRLLLILLIVALHGVAEGRGTGQRADLDTGGPAESTRLEAWHLHSGVIPGSVEKALAGGGCRAASLLTGPSGGIPGLHEVEWADGCTTCKSRYDGPAHRAWRGLLTAYDRWPPVIEEEWDGRAGLEEAAYDTAPVSLSCRSVLDTSRFGTGLLTPGRSTTGFSRLFTCPCEPSFSLRNGCHEPTDPWGLYDPAAVGRKVRQVLAPLKEAGQQVWNSLPKPVQVGYGVLHQQNPMLFPTPQSSVEMAESTFAKPFEIGYNTGTLIADGGGGLEIAASVADDIATTATTALTVGAVGQQAAVSGGRLLGFGDELAQAARSGLGEAGNAIRESGPAWRAPAPPAKVFRVLRPDESPSAGLFAKKPDRGMSVEGHVRTGSRNKGSQYISTTSDLGVARKWAAKDNARIAEIDLSKVNSRIIDVSTPEAAARHIKSPVTRGFAVKSHEVLVEGTVPADAVRLVPSHTTR